MNKPLRRILTAAVFLGGLGAMALMVATRPKAERAPPESLVIPVEVVAVSSAQGAPRISTTGMVQAAKSVAVTPEVSGRITWLSDDLIPGGRLPQGTTYARIDDRDYRLAIDQESSRVQQARLELELEQGRAEVAKREWALLGDDARTNKDLALRKPHLATAQAALKGAEAALARARLNLERTKLTAPMNALVLSENLEVGQVVGPGTVAAQLVGTDALWVKVSIPVDRLASIDIPGFSSDDLGSRAWVVHRLGPNAVEREGTVLRALGELNPETRTAQVLVEVPSPLDQSAGPPLLPGSFVDVSIEGRAGQSDLEVPRVALSNGNQVWIVTDDDVLARRDVQVGWRGGDTVLVSQGLEVGDRVVTSPLSLPIEGQKVAITQSLDAEEPAVVTEVSGG